MQRHAPLDHGAGRLQARHACNEAAQGGSVARCEQDPMSGLGWRARQAADRANAEAATGGRDWHVDVGQIGFPYRGRSRHQRATWPGSCPRRGPGRATRSTPPSSPSSGGCRVPVREKSKHGRGGGGVGWGTFPACCPACWEHSEHPIPRQLSRASPHVHDSPHGPVLVRGVLDELDPVVRDCHPQPEVEPDPALPHVTAEGRHAAHVLGDRDAIRQHLHPSRTRGSAPRAASIHKRSADGNQAVEKIKTPHPDQG